MDICVELHCHTTASDGLKSPREVVRIAKAQNVKLLSITDHDTVDGLEEAVDEAKKLNLNFIPGIELSCTYNKESIHILGFFKGDGYKEKSLITFLEDLKENRINRALKIVHNLKQYFDIDIKPCEVEKLKTGLIARPHIAAAIINSGYNYNLEYIFENFIGNKCPAYVPNKNITVEDGIALLKSYGCVVVLAHPKLVRKTPIDDLMKLGFDGLEGIYFQNTPNETKRFKKLAREKNLLITCGSDFHGISDDDKKHGQIGCMTIPEEQLLQFIEKMKQE